MNEQPIPFPVIEEDPAFVINDEGAEYLAAISRLEETGSTHYLGWYMAGHPGEVNWFASKQDFTISCGAAESLVMAVYALEQANVTLKVETEEIDVTHR